MYIIDKTTKREDFLHLVEFMYNNNYKALIKMNPFKVLYGIKCYTYLGWSHLKEKIILGHYVLQEMEQVVQDIKHNIKIAHDRKKKLC